MVAYLVNRRGCLHDGSNALDTSKDQSMTPRADFTSQEYFRNPAAAIERLRAAGPVVEARLPIVGRYGQPQHRIWPTRC